MDYKQRIQSFVSLGERLRQTDAEPLAQVMATAEQYNRWFTQDELQHALKAWADLLTEERLQEWLAPYKLDQASLSPKKVGIVMAGNIPLVGFHDLLCVLLAGHGVVVRPSADDKVLIEYIIKQLHVINPAWHERIWTAEQLKGIDAVIATGSNNTNRYFEYYFAKYPNILRRNRNSIAVLTGKETSEELQALGTDIFRYFGLGCRSVSKLYLPHDYDFNAFFEALEPYSYAFDHVKYNNNYTYNRAILLMNQTVFKDNGFLILKEDEALASPMATLHYSYYQDLAQLHSELEAKADQLQCVVSHSAEVPQAIKPGQTQQPALNDYADGMDTMSFLLGL